MRGTEQARSALPKMPPRRRKAQRRLAVARSHDQFGSSRLQQAIVLLVASKVAGSILIVSLIGYDVFQLPKSTFSLSTAVVLATLLALGVVRFGPAVIPRTRLHVLVAAFLALNVAATVFAENRYLALFGDVTRLEGLLYVADMLVLYLAVAIAFRGVSDWAILAGIVGAAAFISVLYGAAQGLGLDPLAWRGDPNTRPFSTFGNADIFGHFLSLSLGAAIGIVLFVRTRLVQLMALAFAALATVVGGATATRAFLVS